MAYIVFVIVCKDRKSIKTGAIKSLIKTAVRKYLFNSDTTTIYERKRSLCVML